MPRTARGPVSSANLPADTSPTRREERLALTLPVRLLHSFHTGADEVIPGVLLDLSASGAHILTDQRFSLLLPPTRHTRFTTEFFLDELEIRQAPIQVVRVKKLKHHQLMLGCKFIDLPTAARLALRAEVSKRLSKPRS